VLGRRKKEKKEGTELRGDNKKGTRDKKREKATTTKGKERTKERRNQRTNGAAGVNKFFCLTWRGAKVADAMKCPF
jgi:hypothetical protein